MLITFNKICLVLTYNAEWCAAYGVKREKMGGGMGTTASRSWEREGVSKIEAHPLLCSTAQRDECCLYADLL